MSFVNINFNFTKLFIKKVLYTGSYKDAMPVLSGTG